MTQISKLSKDDLAQTGFKSRTVAAKYIKEVLKKNAKDFKSIDDLKNTLTTQFNNMKNFRVDLNEVHKHLHGQFQQRNKSTMNTLHILHQNYMMQIHTIQKMI